MMLTYAQAQALAGACRNYPVAGSEFYPEDVFPRRNNQDNASRRTLTALAKRGILGGGEIVNGGIIKPLVMTQVALDAYEEWRKGNEE